jgi:hypothetical protein
MATKIQNRARVRMGELIRQIEKATGKKTEASVTVSSRKSLAAKAGLSEKQEHEAKAMSRVPAAKREEMIARLAVTDRLRPIQRQRKKNLSLIWD